VIQLRLPTSDSFSLSDSALVIRNNGPHVYSLRPIADIATEWETVPLWSKIDESSPDDSDVISTPAAQDFYTASVRLSSAPDPQTWLGHVVRFRASFTGAPSNLIVTLLQDGSPLMGAPFPITGTFTTYELPLDSTAANLITNYSDLQIQFEIDSN